MFHVVDVSAIAVSFIVYESDCVLRYVAGAIDTVLMVPRCGMLGGGAAQRLISAETALQSSTM